MSDFGYSFLRDGIRNDELSCYVHGGNVDRLSIGYAVIYDTRHDDAAVAWGENEAEIVYIRTIDVANSRITSMLRGQLSTSPLFFNEVGHSYKIFNSINSFVITPDIAGQTGKFLSNDGTITSWQAIDLSPKVDKTTTVNGHALSSDVVVTKTDLSLNNVDNIQQQPLDSDLTAIAALSPASDDIIQRKSGAWTNRTLIQMKNDLAVPHIMVCSFSGTLNAERWNTFAGANVASDFLKTVMPIAGTFDLLNIINQSNDAGATTGYVKLIKNGVDTTLSCLHATGTRVTDSTHAISVVAGDLISFHFHPGTGTVANCVASARFTPTF